METCRGLPSTPPVRRRDPECQQRAPAPSPESLRIRQDMPLAPLDLLARIKARNAATFCGFD